jgi:SHS2 domain-containing protein
MGEFEFLDTVATADCALEVRGATLDDLFETAARAMAEIMVDPATIVPTVERSLTLDTPALDLLLFDWLAELIFLKDSERLVFTDVHVRVTVGPPCRLAATLVGGPIEPPRTELRADPKAPTFHLFSLTCEEAAGWRARVVIDI